MMKSPIKIFQLRFVIFLSTSQTSLNPKPTRNQPRLKRHEFPLTGIAGDLCTFVGSLFGGRMQRLGSIDTVRIPVMSHEIRGPWLVGLYMVI